MQAFDNDKYLQEQTKGILSRVESGTGRLYLEFGGKLIGDFHASRVLPGFDPNVKIRLLQQLSAHADIIICIHAEAIEQKKIRADFGITYDNAALKLIDDLRDHNIDVTAVVITRFTGQPAAKHFAEMLKKHKIPVYMHHPIPGYPNNIEQAVGPDGFGSNPYIPVTQQLVVVTAPGPSSGKMGTCLSQVFHEYQQGQVARYAKFETFPVWNLTLDHPVNIAYEAATADLHDSNALDNFHLNAYGITAVNYNRDLQAFPLLRTLLTKISSSDKGYQSPTDMGVNCIKAGIVDDEAVRHASNIEIIRRYFTYHSDFQQGKIEEETVNRAHELMLKAGLTPADRPVVDAARQAATECEKEKKGDNGVYCGAAIQLPDGRIVTGKNTSLMHSSASMILNAAKLLAGIPEGQHLILPEIMESVAIFKNGLGTQTYVGLNLSEILIALVVSATRDIYAKKALDCLNMLKRCDVHLSHIPGRGDQSALRHLECSYTYDPLTPTRKLFS